MLNKLFARKLAFALAVCAPVLFLQGCSENIDARQTETTNGLLYKLHDNEPFTGTITNYPLTEFFNVGSCKIQYKKGLPDGMMTCETPDGKKLAEIEFAAGVKSGSEKRWDIKTGELVASIGWKAGRQEGSQEIYDSATGKLIRKITWANGQKAGEEKHWDATGETLLVSLTWFQGKKSGFEKTKEYERNVKDGQNEGFDREYSVSTQSGQRYMSSESNYVSGKREGARTDWDEFGNITFAQVYKNGVVQSQTKQRWKDGKIVATESAVNVSEGGTNGGENAIQKDGKEQATIECGRGLCEFDIDWQKGKAIKGRYTERDGDKLKATYNGVASPTGSGLVKDGVDKKWDEEGNLLLEVLWDKGVALTMVERMEDGSTFKVANPKSNFNDPSGKVNSGFPTESVARTYP